MNLRLQRHASDEFRTHGDLSVDGRWFCFTLEDVVRPLSEKIWGETAIPAGCYEVIVTMSQRFKKELPLLLNVPGFEGVRIHSGNTHEDTNGCILLGKERTHDQVNRSREAMAEFLEMFQTPCWITIVDAG